MASDSDYDIIPHEEISKLRKELNELKQHPLGATSTGKELLDSIKELNKNMSNMFNLFKEAAEEMKLEESEAKLVAEKMQPMMNQFNTLIDQNEKIAKGIVAVADMVKEEAKKAKSRPLPMMVSRPPKVPTFEKSFETPEPMYNSGRAIPNFGSSPHPGAPTPLSVSPPMGGMSSQPLHSNMPSGPGIPSMPPIGEHPHFATEHNAPGPMDHGEHFDPVPRFSGNRPPMPPSMSHNESLPEPPHAPSKKKGLFSF